MRAMMAGFESAVSVFRENIAEILARLGKPPARGAKLYAVLLSFAPLQHAERLKDILSDFHRLGDRLRGAAGGSPVQISESDFVLLTEQTEYAALGAVTDLKMLVLKLIARHAPTLFAGIDQRQLVRVFEMPRHRAELATLLDTASRQRTPADGPRALRMLMPADVEHIMATIDSMPRQEFVDRFVESQPIAVVRRGAYPTVALNEYFVSMALIQKRIVPGTDPLLSRPSFALLAHELDLRVIDCLLKRAIDGRFGSFNFGVDTVFSRRFEELANSGLARDVILEFKVGDVFENYDKFLAAQKLVRSFGGRIALDGTTPAMLGVLKAARLGCDFVKVQFDDSLDFGAVDITGELAEIAAAGARPVLCRVESLAALQAGLAMGVEVFQGFYIDALLRDAAERDRFLAA